ncbi:MAG: glycerol-3-phosphate 1-O-acyltransferase PlsY [Candidatus Omnitrophota bacterium]|nr:glycerol-3-phosphate 1-O-acyltransferase PlsY [Candidatus Omnitrophota bacterium]
MERILQLIAALGGAYLLGSIPTAYLLVKGMKRVDVRTLGSGNVGATNALRVAGRWAGLAVLLSDLAKGLLSVLVIAPLVLRPATSTQQLACGIMAVIGHVFPVFLKFHGGKGVATTIGVLLGTMPFTAGVFLLVWLIAFLGCRYVSVGSMAAAIALPITQLLHRQASSDVLLGAILAIVILVRHRANVVRLVQGQEHRFRLRGVDDTEPTAYNSGSCTNLPKDN